MTNFIKYDLLIPDDLGDYQRSFLPFFRDLLVYSLAKKVHPVKLRSASSVLVSSTTLELKCTSIMWDFEKIP